MYVAKIYDAQPIKALDIMNAYIFNRRVFLPMVCKAISSSRRALNIVP